MNSYSSYEVNLEAVDEDGARRVVYRKSLDALALPWRDETYNEVRHDEALTIEVVRSVTTSALRGLLCNEVIFDLAPGRKRLRLPENCWFLHELGESIFTVEEMDAAEGSFHPIFEINLRIIPSPETLHQYRVMAEDLVEVHAGMARDVVSRAVVRRGAIEATSVHELQPEPIINQLKQAYEAMQQALAVIGRNPSSAVQVTRRLGGYRSGDRPGAAALYNLLRSPGTAFSPTGRLLCLGKAAVVQPQLTTDIEEHRHIAARLQALASLGDTVARHCDQTAALLRHERRRWGASPRSEQASVFETMYLPRIELLERLAAEARTLARRFSHLRGSHAFLRQAEKPRTPLVPTPIFTQRIGYTQAYAVLRRVNAISGLLVDSDSIRLHYRSLASMFEYWCFVKTINWLRERYGSPEPRDGFSVVGAVYRPTLEPGQFFVFTIDDTHALRVTYEPCILPWRQARAEGRQYGATLTANPLRPDIFVEFLHGEHVVAAMVLDAKATTRFSMQKIRDMSDYGRQVFEVKTGRQPVRRVFILHRDVDSDYLSNLPPRRPHGLPPTIEVFGAAACVPEKVNTVPAHLGRLLRSFIRCCLAWSPDAAPSEGTAATDAHPAEDAAETAAVITTDLEPVSGWSLPEDGPGAPPTDDDASSEDQDTPDA